MARRIYGAMLTGDWNKLKYALANTGARFPQAMRQALIEEARFYRSKIVEGIREQAPGGQRFKPLSPVTLAIRKLRGFSGKKALIQTGELRQNVTVKSISGHAVFVGVLYTARGSDGRKLADIARIHEYGATIRSFRANKKLRQLISAAQAAGHLKEGGGGGGMGVLRIPPRPFLQPVFTKYSGMRGAMRFQARVARKMGGLLGVLNHPDLGGRSIATVPARLAAGPTGGATKMIDRAVKATARGLTKGFRKTRASTKTRIARVLGRSINLRIRPAKSTGTSAAKAKGPKNRSRRGSASARSQNQQRAGRTASSVRRRGASTRLLGVRNPAASSARKGRGARKGAYEKLAKGAARRGRGAQHDAHIKAFMKANKFDAHVKARSRHEATQKRKESPGFKARSLAASVKASQKAQAKSLAKQARQKLSAARAERRAIQKQAAKAMRDIHGRPKKHDAHVKAFKKRLPKGRSGVRINLAKNSGKE